MPSARQLDAVIILDKRRPLLQRYYTDMAPSFINDLLSGTRDILTTKAISTANVGQYCVVMKKVSGLSCFFVGPEDLPLCHAFARWASMIRDVLETDAGYLGLIRVTDELVCDGYIVSDADCDWLWTEESAESGSALKTALSGVKLIGKTLLN